MITSVRDWIEKIEEEAASRQAESGVRADKRSDQRLDVGPGKGGERVQDTAGALRDHSYSADPDEDFILTPFPSHMTSLPPVPERFSRVEMDAEEFEDAIHSDEYGADELTIFMEPEPRVSRVEAGRAAGPRPGSAPMRSAAELVESHTGISGIVSGHIQGKWRDETPADTLVHALEGLAEAARKGGAPEEAARLYEDALKLAERGHLAPVLQARLLGRLGEILAAMDEDQRAMDALQHAVMLYQESAVAEHLTEVVGIQNELGLLYKSHGRYEEGERCYHEAIQLRERLDLQLHASLPVLYNNLGCLYHAAGFHQMAINVYRRSVHLWEQLPGSGGAAVADTWRNMGLAAMATADWPAARDFLHAALNGFSRLTGNYERPIIELLLNLAGVHEEEGAYSDAEIVMIQAINEYEAMHPRADALTGLMFNNLGCIYAKTGYHAEARRMFEKSLAIKRSLTATHPQDLAVAYSNLAVVAQELDALSQARRYFEKALGLLEGAQKSCHEAHDRVSALYHDCLRPAAQRIAPPMAQRVLSRSFRTSQREMTTFSV